MVNFLFRLVLLCTLLVAAFGALSFWRGGEKFRWFGKRVEEQSERVGAAADRLKEGGDSIMKGLEKAGDRVKGLTGKKDDKSR